ncbi:MAG TPA: nuclear transport factor 2 family protein [Solirubrobacterales bacterium]|nr:nuclear transport factor 2 family protein [Solirubrobacterales bacterium]
MSAQNVEIARRGYEAFNRGGVEAILDYMHRDIEWRMWEQFTREARVFHGHGGVREVLGIFYENFDDFRVEPLELIDAGEQVVVPLKLHGRAKGTGEPNTFELVQVWTVEGAKAIRLDVYADRGEALRATGVESGG